jgi:hypothetical protein
MMNTRNSIPGAESRGKRGHVADVSDKDSPEYNPSDPDFDPEWEENSKRAITSAAEVSSVFPSAREVVDGLRKK